MDSNNKNRNTYSGNAFWNSPGKDENLPESKQTTDAEPQAQTPELTKSFEQVKTSLNGDIHPVITKDKKTALPPKKAIIIIAVAAAVIIIGAIIAIIAVNTGAKSDSKQPVNPTEVQTTVHALESELVAETTKEIISTKPETTSPPNRIDAQVEYETRKREIKSATYFKSASASSVLPNQAGHNYSASNVLSNNGACWCEGASGYGEGEWIRLELPELQKVSGLRIINGYAGSEKQYDYNSKISSATIDFSDGRSVVVSLNVFDSSDRKTVQTVRFNEPIETEFVRITINGVEPGDCEDTCLTFVEPF